MEYKYITENNLDNRQKYEYSTFGGNEFLQAYLTSRRKMILELAEFKSEEKDLYSKISLQLEEDSADKSDFVALDKLIREQIKNYYNFQMDFNTIDAIVKTFEVRKRLYHCYTPKFKPLDEEDYKDIELYLMFSFVMCCTFKLTSNLKYLNVLIKVNDTLISIKEQAKELLNKQMLFFVLQRELDFVINMMQEKKIRV